MTNGIGNLSHGQHFFHGAGQAAFSGLVSGGLASGIGGAAAGISNGLARATFQTVAHGLLGGMMSGASGGSFGSGFLAGGFGSLAAGGTQVLLGGISDDAVRGASMFAAGTAVGGFASEIGGGNFWDGARDGAISAGLNHVAHMLMEGDDDPKPKKPSTNKTARDEQLNLNEAEHLIGPTLYEAGQRVLALKPIGAFGSEPGSSVASTVLRKVPGTLRGMLGGRIGGAIARLAGTNGLGASLGRLVPWIGGGLMVYDFTSNIALPMANGMSQYREYNIRSGNWINNLPH